MKDIWTKPKTKSAIRGGVYSDSPTGRKLFAKKEKAMEWVKQKLERC